MFTDEPISQVILFAMTVAVVLTVIATTAAKIYETETRPWGHECKAGDTKPRTKDSFEADRYRGYWEYYPPGLP
jgi:hypothetical protein